MRDDAVLGRALPLDRGLGPHEQGLGAKAIRSRYPAKQWSLNTEDYLSPHYQDGIGCDSSVWQWTAKISSNCAEHRCCRRHDLLSRVPARYEQKLIAKTLGMSDRSVRRIAKMDLELSAFRRMPAQILSDAGILNGWNDAELF